MSAKADLCELDRLLYSAPEHRASSGPTLCAISAGSGVKTHKKAGAEDYNKDAPWADISYKPSRVKF